MNVFQNEFFQLLRSQVAINLRERRINLIEGCVCIIYIKVIVPVLDRSLRTGT